MSDLSKTVALVTGGARGIGRGCAIRLAEAGASVIVHCNTSRSDADKTLGMLGDRGLGAIAADLSDPSAAKELAQRVTQEWPRVNLLVNNAGIYEPLAFADAKYETVLAHWQRTLGANLMSAVGLSYWFVRHVREHGGGKIVNIASRAGFRGEAGAAAYAASKAAMINFTKSLAVELVGERIYSYAIAPGWTDTPMVDGTPPERLREVLATIPFGRMATAEEIGACVAFLGSADADYLTGITIDANGASYLR